MTPRTAPPTATSLRTAVHPYRKEALTLPKQSPADAQGGWSFMPTGLADGVHTIVASQIDGFGNTGTASLTFTLDTAAPTGAAPVLTPASNSGTPQSANVTDVTAPTFTVALGAADEAGDTVQLLLDGSPLAHPVTHIINAAEVSAVSVNLTVVAGDLGADGSKSVSAQFSDLAGNNSITSALSFTLDTVPPTVAISATGTVTNQATHTISGTVAAGEAAVGATVTLYDNGRTTPLGTAIVGSGGTWSTTVTLSGDGPHSIVARDTDAAGNTGASTPLVLTLDTVPPTVAISTAGGITNQLTHTISGAVTGRASCGE